MEDEVIRLFMELLKLQRKYGKTTFRKLAEELSNPKTVQNLGIIASTFSNNKIAKPSGSTPKSAKLPNSILQIKSDDPTRFEMLKELFISFQSRSIFTNIKSLKEFLEVHDLGVPKVNTRSKIALYSIKKASDFPNERLRDLLDELKNEVKMNGDLQKWADIIMGNEKLKETSKRDEK